MIRPGKKTREWERERAKLKKKFLQAGISYCEVMHDPAYCWRNMGLGFAHSKKRRNIVGDEIREVILACPQCHQWLEYELSEKEMTEFVRNVIKNRNVVID